MSNKRKTPGLNTGSMSDITFLLLTFFLITSSIDTDTGIMRRLPPPLDPNNPPPDMDIKERNVLKVFINKNDLLLVQNQVMTVRDLKETAKQFLSNPTDRSDFPEKVEEEIPGLGTVKVSKGVISLKNDRGTSYDAYIQVQNELTAAINELRDDLSKRMYGVKYADLTNETYINAISKAIPVAISEAEPENIGD
ncbi:MAG: biopolymer transporter ExbD [Lentimicrobiaceae bacterium]|nr:biopolymer transporter ExbD [Lentimicrobiaceae bacterium]